MPSPSALEFTEVELADLRAQTPAWGHDAHFSHGSASLPAESVYAAWSQWLDAERSMGMPRALEALSDDLGSVHCTVAQLINAQPHQIALLDSASHAWSAAMSSCISGPDDIHVISTHDEYGSNSLCLLAAQRRLRLTVISARDEHESFAHRLTQAIDQVPIHCRVVVSLCAVPTAYGVATELQRVATLIQQRNGLLFVDASHAVGQIPVDVAEIGCDVLVFPARKWLRGPKGIAALYVSDRALEQLGAPVNVDVAGAQWTGHSTLKIAHGAQRFEGQEFNPGLRLAFKAACDLAFTLGPHRIALQNARVRAEVANELRRRLGWESHEGNHPRATALMTFPCPSHHDEHALVRTLLKAGVSVSVVGRQQARWALEATGQTAVLRLTPHYLTSDQEIAQLGRALQSLRA